MKLRKLLFVAAALVVLLLLAAVVGFFILDGSGRAVRTGEATLAGLQAPVTVRFDRWGVPHLAASGEEDLAAAVGYLHANDRMAQLELGRRACSGRLAELLGERALPFDRRSLTLRLRRAAEGLWKSAGEESRRWLTGYARGVEAWRLERGDDLPPELRLLGVELEPWTPVDSLCFIELMARDLSMPVRPPEEVRLALYRRLGAERARELLDFGDVHEPPQLASWIAEGALSASAGGARPRLPADPRVAARPAAGEALPAGSNSWAVGASRSVTGAPLVANDPHLGLGVPSTWFEVQLRAPGFAVAGMTLPGLPVVVVGQSERLAWSLTFTQLDDHDLFFERLDRDGRNVRRGDAWQPVERETVQIGLRGGGSEALEIARTDRGPLLPADPGRGLPARSLAWTAQLPTDPLSAFLGLAHVATVAEVPAAVASYAAPAQNLVVADRDGGLLFTLLGWVPDRRRGDGRLPSPGWDPAYGWAGVRAPETNPTVLAPADDLLVTANNDIRPPGYELPLPADFAPRGDRARRIDERLRAHGGWDATSTAALQADVVSLYARELVRLLSGEYDGDAGRAYRALADWDGAMAARGPSALFLLAERELIDGIFGDDARAAKVPALGNGERLARLLAGEMDTAWFDDQATPAVEGRDEQIAAALARAWRQGRSRWGPDVAAWRYDLLHPLLLRHPLGALPVAGLWVNRGPVPVAGAPSAIAAFSGFWQGEQQQTVRFGPSMRWVADLADPDRSLAAVLPGQAGHPGDPHYDDQLTPFVAGESHPVAFSEEAVAAAAVSTLTLHP